MQGLLLLLRTLGELVIARNGGVENDVSKLLHLGAVAVAAGEEGKVALEAAVAKVQQLVAEDRALTDEENAAIDASIAGKLAAIADTKIEDAPASPGGTG